MYPVAQVTITNSTLKPLNANVPTKSVNKVNGQTSIFNIFYFNNSALDGANSTYSFVPDTASLDALQIGDIFNSYLNFSAVNVGNYITGNDTFHDVITDGDGVHWIHFNYDTFDGLNNTNKASYSGLIGMTFDHVLFSGFSTDHYASLPSMGWPSSYLAVNNTTFSNIHFEGNLAQNPIIGRLSDSYPMSLYISHVSVLNITLTSNIVPEIIAGGSGASDYLRYSFVDNVAVPTSSGELGIFELNTTGGSGRCLIENDFRIIDVQSYFLRPCNIPTKVDRSVIP